MQSDPTQNFLKECGESFCDGSFAKLTLSNYKGMQEQLARIHIRKIRVKREEKLSFTYQYKTRDIVKNYSPEEAMQMLQHMLAGDFHGAMLSTTKGDLQLQRHPGGKVKVTKMAATHTEPADTTHDRQKKRFIQPEGKFYLRALDVTDENGKVHKNAQDKFRQIDKYVEIVSGLIKNIPPEKLTRIVDMGCGKGYLTFALYDYIYNMHRAQPEVIGVDTRADMVALCNKIAKESGFMALRFVQDSIGNYDSSGASLLIALHACDTATDEAIAKGITAGAEIIMVAPCCHKQIRRQMTASAVENDVSFLTRHGIFAERQAEMVTDGLRALILEYFGYSTKVFEFISDAHTPKNVMIVGTKTKALHNPEILEKIKATKARFGIDQHFLEKAMGLC